MKPTAAKIMLSLALAVLSLCQTYAQDPWILTATSRDNYAGITLANGRIGLVTSARIFDLDDVMMNGVYDRQDNYDGVSYGVSGPNPLYMTLILDGTEVKDGAITNWKQTLNMREASSTTSFDCDKGHVEYTLQALRNMPHTALSIVEVTPNKDMRLEAINRSTHGGSLHGDIQHFQRIHEGREHIPLFNLSTKTEHDIYEVATSSTFVLESPEENAKEKEVVWKGQKALYFSHDLKAGETYRFAVAGAICTSRDFSTPRNEAQRMIINVVCNGLEKTLAAHKAEWSRLWQSDIIIEGDAESQQDVHSALYHLYSFIGEDNGESPSPMGLSSNGYNRHIFWDSEIWMYPPMLMLNGGMAKSMVDYRINRIGEARQKAQQLGYKGVMFPWESDDSGEEACPVWALTGPLEQHVTADVAIAAWNYYCVTQDKEWLRNDGYTLIKNAADFIASRVTRNTDGSYSFCNVVGADEYAVNVDDNAYTNATAKVALEYAIKAGKILKEKTPTEWKQIADGMLFHYFDDGVMKEHATYNGEEIKQGDVNLLTYPLGIMTEKQEVLKNLRYYEPKIDPHGPAMGNCILSTIYASMGDKDNAFRLFKKCYVPHKCAPFGVLSEGAGGNNPYFATGAGGMLQAVLAGFGGLRITQKGIRQVNPCLPNEWTKLTITGVGPDKRTYVVER